MYLFGASGHGKVIAEIAESNALVIDGFIDTDLNKTDVLDYPVFHEVPSGKIEVVIAIGNNKVRKSIVNDYVNFKYVKLEHAHSHISKRTSIGSGTVIMAGVTVNVDVNIGKHCIINTNASVDHDCVIADFVHISPNAALAGNVVVGEGTHIGIGAVVIQGVKIGGWCIIGAGAVIIKDIPDGCTVVGNPGRVINK
ncbi:acetyltransferase [Sphingobacterium faecium]|uniref:acetyltransferase n=1 Tax=Sphingobacterium faecium TaxID=34087 RepID=UPI0024683395|nr:acetyltransferase [Sphingobacterium faecium]MDH5828703.1 acetyltransferase [Sphingobacterium faecium]